MEKFTLPLPRKKQYQLNHKWIKGSLAVLSFVLISCHNGSTNSDTVASTDKLAISSAAETTLRYDFNFGAKPLNELKNPKLQHFIDSTYFVVGVTKDLKTGQIEQTRFSAVAVEGILLTAAHAIILGLDLEQKKSQLTQLLVYKASNKHIVFDASLDDPKQRLQKVKFSVNSESPVRGMTSLMSDLGTIDLGSLYLDDYLEMDSETVTEGDALTYLKNNLLTANNTVYGIGLAANNDQTIPNFATKMSGSDNFTLSQQKRYPLSKNDWLIQASDNLDTNHHQLAGLHGDSGGPWILCNPEGCKLFAIQSSRKFIESNPIPLVTAEPILKMVSPMEEWSDPSNGKWPPKSVNN